VPCVYLSATNKTNIHEVIDNCIKIYSVWNKRISTNKMNDWLGFATEAHQLPLQSNGRRVRVKYCTQIKTRPPTFKFFCNYPDKIPESYMRYLINDMRENFKLPGVPIRISFVKSDNPYAKNSTHKKRR